MDKGYVFAIPNLPLFPNRRVKKFVEYISKLDGFTAFVPHYPEGTLLVFKSKNEAIRGRNLIKSYDGYKGGVGTHIMECDYDPTEIIIKGVAD